MEFQTEAIRQRAVMWSCRSYCAHIRRVTKKEEGPHYIINGNSNLRHNDDCKLHECLGNTTVRRKIKVEAVTVADDKIKAQQPRRFFFKR